VTRSAARRSTTNRNARGGSKDRRVRKQWLLDTFGDGTEAICTLQLTERCEGTVTFDSMTVDRYPVAGIDGGTYKRGNIQPACAPCNEYQGGQMGPVRKAQRRAAA
jgi:hypothetical protein